MTKRAKWFRVLAACPCCGMRSNLHRILDHAPGLPAEFCSHVVVSAGRGRITNLIAPIEKDELISHLRDALIFHVGDLVEVIADEVDWFGEYLTERLGLHSVKGDEKWSKPVNPRASGVPAISTRHGSRVPTARSPLSPRTLPPPGLVNLVVRSVVEAPDQRSRAVAYLATLSPRTLPPPGLVNLVVRSVVEAPDQRSRAATYLATLNARANARANAIEPDGGRTVPANGV